MNKHNQNISKDKKGKGQESITVNTKKLMKKIKAMNALFDNDDHHDSHEFLTWLLNQIHEEIVASMPEKPKDGGQSFVTECFEGKLASKTACFGCESGNEREETFMALSIDVEQKGTSLNHCIK